MLAEQQGGVLRVLGVQLDDLELGEQEVARGQRRRVERQPPFELEPVAHLERAHEHVELAGGPVEDHAAIAVQRVEARLRLVPGGRQRRGDRARLRARDERVEVGDLAVRRAAERALAVQHDPGAAEQAHRQAA
jgi:hypothetical protein